MSSVRPRVQLLSGLVLLLIVIHVINVKTGGALSQFGVVPRSPERWHHVFWAPFIHTSYAHLFNNLVGLVVFSALCLLRSIRFYLASSLFIFIVGGLLVWMFGRAASHVGASGWIFGLWSLCVAIAWFDRRFGNILLAVLVLFFYGGMIFGVLPSDPAVSFEMHLAGAIAGILCAFAYAMWARRTAR